MENTSKFFIPWYLAENDVFGCDHPIKWTKDWLQSAILSNKKYKELIGTHSFYITPEGILVHYPENAYCRIIGMDINGVHCVYDGCGLKDRFLEYFYDSNMDLRMTNSYMHFVDHLEYEYSIEECYPGWIWDYTWLCYVDKNGERHMVREP